MTASSATRLPSPIPRSESFRQRRSTRSPINLGDLGTKGGLKADAHARVLGGDGQVIPNLYAAGNASGSPFGNCYPGAGGTIGPAMTFGYVAANHIASRAGAAVPSRSPPVPVAV